MYERINSNLVKHNFIHTNIPSDFGSELIDTYLSVKNSLKSFTKGETNMYDTLIVKNITDLALAMKDLYDDNRELKGKVDNYRAETKRLNEKIIELNTELNERDKLIEEIRANIEARLEECI